MGKQWTERHGEVLQDAIDRVFERVGDRLKGLSFSFTIADPSLPDCPLIGCSTGFSTLCGYEMKEIVGRNCRFLVDPVPREQVDDSVRRMAREFSIAVGEGRTYKIPEHERKPYMPASRPLDDGLFLMQMNARKDGTLFNNMFYLKAMELDDKQYIVGLQTELTNNTSHELCHEACRLLDENMGEVEKVFSREFWCIFAMRRQDDLDANDGFMPGAVGQQEEFGTPILAKRWTEEQGAKLQEAIDRVFGVAGDSLKGVQFSLTIADPMLDECPLIGCSTGFGTLCGYEMHEIVGHNCKFLVDPVPNQLVNNKVKRLAKQFCLSAKEGFDFKLPEQDREPWMPTVGASDHGLFCAQRNAKKDGSLFANMFYLRRVELDDNPYIIGLQTELPAASLSFNDAQGPTEADDVARMEACHRACRMLDANMADLEKVLASMFWYSGPMRRQDIRERDDSYQGPVCSLEVPPQVSPQPPPLVQDEVVAIEKVSSPNGSGFKASLSRWLAPWRRRMPKSPRAFHPLVANS